jgi:hypothetical protein
MSGVQIKKIPMKNLSPKEMAELAFDQGVTRGGSGTANTLKRGGLKRGAYGQGVGKYKDGGDVKYKGPLPMSKPTDLERWQGFRSTNKPTNAEEQERIDKRMVEKFKKSKKAQRYEEGGNVISDADAKALKKLKKFPSPSESGKTISDADAKLLKKMPLYKPEHGKSISDADFEKLRKYEDGGEVRGMGRAYQGKKRGCKIR